MLQVLTVYLFTLRLRGEIRMQDSVLFGIARRRAFRNLQAVHAIFRTVICGAGLLCVLFRLIDVRGRIELTIG